MTRQSQPLENNPEIASGDLEAMHSDLFRWACSNAGFDRELARDVLQEVYLRIWSGRARFDGLSSLRTWLYAVIRNTAVDYRRAGTSALAVLQRFSLLSSGPSGTPGVDMLIELDQEARQLMSALLSLSTQQRLVLELVFYNDMTVEEAAGVMGVTVGTARRHYARGKERLRRTLEGGPKTKGIQPVSMKLYG